MEDIKPGVISFHARLSVLPQVGEKGIGTRLLYELWKYELSQGYQFSFSGTMLNVSTHILQKMGSELLRSKDLVWPHVVVPFKIFKTDHKKVVEMYEKRYQARL